MEVRLKIGRYAGDVRDIRADVARALIANGSATDIRSETGALPAAEARPEIQAQPPRAEVPTPAKRWGKKR
jgi:endonuclease YncB( thermonuclease family)